MEHEFRNNIYWFMFIMGLVSFGGISVTVVIFLRSIPASFKILSKQMTIILKALNSSDALEHFQNVKAHDDRLKVVIDIIETVEKQIDNLKYQHDHPENFFFGTEKTNKMLQQVSDRLVTIEAQLKAEALFRRQNGGKRSGA